MDWGVIISIGISVITLLIALFGGAIAFGALKARFEEKIAQLEKRADEDRQNDREKFQELFSSRNSMQSEISEIVATIKALCDRLERIEPKLDELVKQGAK